MTASTKLYTADNTIILHPTSDYRMQVRTVLIIGRAYFLQRRYANLKPVAVEMIPVGASGATEWVEEWFDVPESDLT